jgi:hypothetical protein
VREQVAKALVYEGKILAAQGELGMATDLYDEVVGCFGQDASPGVCLQVAQALLCKSEIVEDEAEAVAICDEVVRRYGEDASPDICRVITLARALKDELLAKQG